MTGLPGSGKSATSHELIKLLNAKGIRAQLLSSDSLRKVMTPQPTYALEERDNVYATLVHAAKLLTMNGINVIIDATGNLRRYREKARKNIPTFKEVFLTCPLNVCIEREKNRKRAYHAPRKIYSTARKISTVPGIGQPYEPPQKPELMIDTTKCTPKQCAEQILEKIPELWR